MLLRFCIKYSPVRSVTLLVLSFLLFCFIRIPVYAEVVINEIYPKPSDEVSEWIELYNTGPDTVTLDGWRLENSNGEKKIYQITGITIPAANFVRLNQSQTGIKLFNDGDSVHLYDGGGNEIDVQGYPSILGYNNSVGRSSDGTGVWTFCELATPNNPNACTPPTLPLTPVITETPAPTSTTTPSNTPTPDPTRIPTSTIVPPGSAVKGVTYDFVAQPTPTGFMQSEEYKSLWEAGIFIGAGLFVIVIILGIVNSRRRR